MSSRPLEQKLRQARGEEPADFVLRGGTIFDVIGGGLYEADITLCGDTIVGVDEGYEGKEVVDLSGLILVPGFIDTHFHVESSLITPLEFERCVAPRGVTTGICDPHEIANVIGAEGIKYFQSASESMLMDLRVQLSACVPSSHMETSGATLLADDLLPLKGHPSGIGLAEFMNYPGVVQGDPECLAKLDAFSGEQIDGHAPLLSGHALNAYLTAGISTEHEATNLAEAREKLRKGMRVLIREGSVSKDLDVLEPLLTDITSAYVCLCTDDRNPLEIAEQGHLDYMIRRLIALGTSPLSAYRAATLSAAEAFGLKDRGVIAPGKRADIVAIDTLETCNAQHVWCGGVRLTEAAFSSRAVPKLVGLGSVHAKTVSAADFVLTETTPKTDVIGVRTRQILTDHLHLNITPVGGDKQPDPQQDLARISVVERHGKNGNMANGFVRGFGIKSGAIASTVCHDHHNTVAVGVDYGDMALACNRLSEIDGGFVVVNNGEVLSELALPVAGLMSAEPFETVHGQLVTLRAAARTLGIVLEEPFLQLAFLALPVIPSLKITDMGLVDVEKFEIIKRA
ncbi:MAG: adenine deaminase [Pseudomonadota bacterium]